MTKRDKRLRTIIAATVGDCASRFFYYDRKEDDELSADDLQSAIDRGVVTREEIAEWFVGEDAEP